MKKGEESRIFGIMVEDRMRKMFKGKERHLDEVDFETSKYLYEVKSCKLFNKCCNGNNRRKFKDKPHKQIETTQLGRFQIIIENHKKLQIEAKKVNKIAKYVFCLRFGKQVLFKVLEWKKVDKLIVPKTDKEYYYILLKNIFIKEGEK